MKWHPMTNWEDYFSMSNVERQYNPEKINEKVANFILSLISFRKQNKKIND